MHSALSKVRVKEEEAGEDEEALGCLTPETRALVEQLDDSDESRRLEQELLEAARARGSSSCLA